MSKGISPAAVALALVVAGCGREAPDDPELACRDRHVTVTHAPGYLTLYPEHIEICAGYSFVIAIAPPVEPGAAHTVPAGEKRPVWLEAENRERDRIEIRVPGDTEYDTYKYSVTIEGIGSLDPRVTVSRR